MGGRNCTTGSQGLLSFPGGLSQGPSSALLNTTVRPGAPDAIIRRTQIADKVEQKKQAKLVSDEYTLTRIAAGDPNAVGDCMKKFSGLVWSLVRSKLGNSAEAEDLTQDIFVEIWKSAGRFDPNAGSEAAFIATITRRRTIDRLRSLGRKPETEEFDESTAPSKTVGFEQIAVDADRARAALETLREDQRSLILMGVVEGMTHSEIATATGKPLGTVKTQMRRGLAKVRAMLEDDGDSDLPGAANG